MTTEEWRQYLQQTQVRRRRGEIGVAGAYWRHWLAQNRQAPGPRRFNRFAVRDLTPLQRAAMYDQNIGPDARALRCGKNRWYIEHGSPVTPRAGATVRR